MIWIYRRQRDDVKGRIRWTEDLIELMEVLEEDNKTEKERSESL